MLEIQEGVDEGSHGLKKMRGGTKKLKEGGCATL